VRLADLLAVGLLCAGEEVACKGATAIVTAEGQLHAPAFGPDFATPSAWATAGARAQAGPGARTSCNGWAAVRYNGQALDVLRQRYWAEGHVPPPAAVPPAVPPAPSPAVTEAAAAATATTADMGAALVDAPLAPAAARRRRPASSSAAAASKRRRTDPIPAPTAPAVAPGPPLPPGTIESPAFVAVQLPGDYGADRVLCAACGSFVRDPAHAAVCAHCAECYHGFCLEPAVQVRRRTSSRTHTQTDTHIHTYTHACKSPCTVHRAEWVWGL
jgi:hypothetical protein